MLPAETASARLPASYWPAGCAWPELLPSSLPAVPAVPLAAGSRPELRWRSFRCSRQPAAVEAPRRTDLARKWCKRRQLSLRRRRCRLPPEV